MIIGAKRREEIIKSKRYGIFDAYHIRPIRPVVALALYKGLYGWEIWEMIHDDVSNLAMAYRPIAAYKTESIEKMLEIGRDKNLPVLTNSRGEYI